MNKRDSINEILLALNELPLDITDNVEDIQIATIVDKQLDITKRKILSKGWYFNTTTRDLYPNVQGNIVIPLTFLSTDGGDNEPNLMVRDWKLFDKSEMSFIFDKSKECKVVEDIVFDDIPFIVADYITQVASLQAYINIIGNTEDISIRNRMIDIARIDAYREDANNRDGNILESDFVTGLLDRENI